MLFIITSTSTLFAQSQLTPTRIDVSEYFEKINKYNTHIKDANESHYAVSKQFSWKVVSLLIGIAGGIYTLNQATTTGNNLWYGGVGASLGTIIGVFGPSNDTDKYFEQNSLSRAKEILEELKTGK